MDNDSSKWLNNMNLKNIVWFIKTISYFVLLRSLGIIIIIIIIIIIVIVIVIIIILSRTCGVSHCKLLWV